MQLANKQSIRGKLALATITLLTATSVEASEIESFSIDASSLYYGELDRVTVNKFQALLSQDLSDENKIKLNAVYDTMSGASPNGRIYQPSKQLSDKVPVTSASGFSFLTSTNTDDSLPSWLSSFNDERIGATLDWEHSVTQSVQSVIGIGSSVENDYQSYTYSAKADWDVNQRRTTFTVGGSLNSDKVKPNGGIPRGLDVLWCRSGGTALRPDWLNCAEPTVRYKPADKLVSNIVVGVTQVWNRRTLFQFNYALGNESGYLTDPYKQISVTSNLVNGEEVAILHEKRPDSRQTNSLFFNMVSVPFDITAIHLSYRYFWDNWKINGHTVDGRFIVDLPKKSQLQIHGRVSYQTAAFFFDEFIATEDLNYIQKPQYFTADHRLSQQATATVGIKYSLETSRYGKYAFRIEQMRQYYKNNLIPDMKALIAQVFLTFKF